MISRAVTLPDDFAPLDAFFRACEAADSLDLDLHRHALQDPQTPDHFQVYFDTALCVQGFARLHFSELEDVIEGRYWYYVGPSITNPALAASLLQWAEQQTRQRHAKNAQRQYRLSTASRADHPARFQFLEANGFTRERCFLTMKRALLEALPAPEVPAGYTLRTPTLADLSSYTDLHNLTFRDHWNSPPITVDDLRVEQLAPSYRPELDILAVTPDGTLVSFCTATIETGLGKREGTGRAVGFISTLGTHPLHRGRGLGRALLLHTLRTLHALGIDLCYISVDTTNVTRAGRLYEAVGFQTFETWLAYFKSL
jgi:mycothiol synthase